MALHIQMSEEAEREYKRAKLRGMISSFGASSALCLTFALTLTFTVIYFAQDPPAEFLAYVPPAEDLPPRAVPTTPQLSSKAATPSNTVAPSVIVSTGAAPVAMAQIDIPMEDSADDGISIDIGIGLDTGLGDDLGEAGSGMGSSQPAGSALEGTLYDLKQSKGGAPTKVAPGGKVDKNELYATVGGYLKNWSQSALARFYKSPAKLYASNFFVPMANASLAPDAFQCANKVKPAAWVVVYRGKVKSPITGTIRFVGTGDDFLGVRFDGKVVLEGGYRLPSAYKKGDMSKVYISGARGREYRAAIKAGKDSAHREYEFIQYPGIPTWNNTNTEIGGLTAGKHIKVKEGVSYPIEIAITEEGGKFGYVLMWENLSDNPVIKNGKVIGGKKLYLFRTNFSMPEKSELQKLIGKHAAGKEMEWPEFDSDSPIWVAVP
ncbi:MAG: hypothetical protein IJX33_03370 [Akkermansia sp.]|nr:hypothetical protein [Akkermansia sp.]